MFYDNERKNSGESISTSDAGKLGGEKVARERGPEFYSEIGKKGGEAVSKDREHMAEIGRKGGEARSVSESDIDES